MEEQLPQHHHTQVPNLVSDVVCPLIAAPEREVLRYVIRRTYGFTDGNGGRRARDTISLEQFQKGIQSGNYLLDLGTGLSRNTIRKAIDGLIEKELIEPRCACTRCLWEQQAGSEPPEAEEGKAPLCPRCRRTLSTSYALAPLTPRKILKLLNENDPEKRKWSYEKEGRRFVFESEEETPEKKAAKQASLREQAVELRGRLWYPELVDKAVSEAETQLKAGNKISLSRRINNFYRPVFDLQEEFGNPPLIKYALEETLKHGVLKRRENRRWFAYTRVVCVNQERNFTGKGPAEGTNEEAIEAKDIRSREIAARDLLSRASELNDAGNREAARVLLSDLLGQVGELAELFGGDQKLCEAKLRQAFKAGSSDFVAASPSPWDIDFYPEWSWPDELPKG